MSNFIISAQPVLIPLTSPECAQGGGMTTWTETTQSGDYGRRYGREVPGVGRIWVVQYPATLERAGCWQAYRQSDTGSKRIGTVHGFTSKQAAMDAADAWAQGEEKAVRA